MITQKENGFSLIELLVVATIIIVLSAIGLVSYSNSGKSARDSRRQADLETVRQAMVLHRTEEGSYPAANSWSDLMTALADYVSEPHPEDPKTNEANYGYEVRSDGTNFCLCANLENDDGNASGYASSTSCPFGGDSSHYCVENP